jgi:hypothetical protein
MHHACKPVLAPTKNLRDDKFIAHRAPQLNSGPYSFREFNNNRDFDISSSRSVPFLCHHYAGVEVYKRRSASHDE